MIVNNFPAKPILTDESVSISVIPKERKIYYKNIVKYLDEHLYFIYLKASDPLYGMNFNTQLPYYLRVNVGISIAIVLYQRAFPDDEEIHPIILNMIQTNINNDILKVTPNILSVKEQLSE